MNRKIRILSLLAVLVLALTTGCSAEATTSDVGYDSLLRSSGVSPMATAEVSMYEEVPMYEEATDTAAADYGAAKTAVSDSDSLGGEVNVNNGSLGGEVNVNEPIVETRKLIVTTSLSLETKEFDKGTALIESLANKYNGYIENSNIQGTNMMYEGTARYAYYTLRIPSAGSNDLIKELEGDFHVVSMGQSTQDITESYYDIETRLETLVEQETRLNSLLEGGGDLEYLLAVEKEIAQVRYQINSIYNQLKNMDSQVDFSTININISEVIDYADTSKASDTFITRINRAFKNSWANFVSFAQESIIVGIMILPALIIIAAILIVAILIVRKSRKSSKKKKITVEQNSNKDK